MAVDHLAAGDGVPDEAPDEVQDHLDEVDDRKARQCRFKTHKLPFYIISRSCTFDVLKVSNKSFFAGLSKYSEVEFIIRNYRQKL